MVQDRFYEIKENLHRVEINGVVREILLPSRFATIEPQQLHILDQILSAFDDGVRLVMLQAPCGVGKTLVAEIVRQCLGEKMLYLPPHLELQDQFVREFTYANLLKGRSNFAHGGATGRKDFPRVTCADCMENSLCGGDKKVQCDYSRAKDEFLSSEVGVANLSYFLAAANGINMFVPLAQMGDGGGDKKNYWGKWIGDGGKWITVIDEAHVLEDTVKSFLAGFWGVKPCRN